MGGKISSLTMDLDQGIITESEKRQKKKMLVDYLYNNLKNHNFWAYKYFFCEFLGLLNISGQMFLMDRFFDGTFFTFGIEVLSFAERDQEDRIDPMVYIFPRMTKCTFHKFGTSGEIEKHDAMCILPLNIDLYFLVVLVPAVGISHLLGVSLQNINCGVSEIKGLLAVSEVQIDQEGVHQHHREKDQDGGLLPPLHDGAQHRRCDLQGGCAGARQEVGISQQRYLRILVNILDNRYHIF